MSDNTPAPDDHLRTEVIEHLLIRDGQSGEVLLSRREYLPTAPVKPVAEEDLEDDE